MPTVHHLSELTGQVIGAAIAVHREMGPGLDERVYEAMLSGRLSAEGVSHRCQVPLPLTYKSVKLDYGYRMDVMVEETLVVEVKSVELLAPIHDAQLLTYLRLSGRQLGLLINFDVPVLKDGLHRRILRKGEENPPSVLDDRGRDSAREFEPLSREVLAAAVEVHRTLGPGLLRSTYEECLCYELSVRGIAFEREVKFAGRLGKVELPAAITVPLLVDHQIPVECLSVPELNELHRARQLARLRQGGWRSGLLLNFNVTTLSAGIRRVVNLS